MQIEGTMRDAGVPQDEAAGAFPDGYAAWCRCGEPVTERAPDAWCVDAAAHHHTARVGVRSELLLNRLLAIRLMGTLRGEPRPLAAFR